LNVAEKMEMNAGRHGHSLVYWSRTMVRGGFLSMAQDLRDDVGRFDPVVALVWRRELGRWRVESAQSALAMELAS